MNHSRLGSIALVLLVASACGKAKDKDPAKDKGAGTSGGTAVAAGSGAVPAVPTPAAAPPPPKPTVIVAGDVSVDKALGVAELDRIVKQWPDRGEFTFVGYPVFFIGSDDTLRTGLELAAQPEQKKDQALVICDLAATEAGKHVDNKTAVTIKGKLRGIWSGTPETVWFEDCVVVAQGGTAKADALPIAGSAEPVAVERLSAAYMGWKGKELTVTGAYFGSTISRGSGDAIIDVRIDLLTEIGNYDGKVGCHLPLVVPDPALEAVMEKNRPALTVRGTLKEGLHRGAQLDPCTVVSQ